MSEIDEKAVCRKLKKLGDALNDFNHKLAAVNAAATRVGYISDEMLDVFPTADDASALAVMARTMREFRGRTMDALPAFRPRRLRPIADGISKDLERKPASPAIMDRPGQE